MIAHSDRAQQQYLMDYNYEIGFFPLFDGESVIEMSSCILTTQLKKWSKWASLKTHYNSSAKLTQGCLDPMC